MAVECMTVANGRQLVIKPRDEWLYRIAVIEHRPVTLAQPWHQALVSQGRKVRDNITQVSGV